MMLPRGLVWALDRHIVSRSFGMPYRAGRLFLEALALLDPVPGEIEIKRGSVGGRPALLAVPPGAGETPALVWIHGGAFCFNSPRVVAAFAGHLARSLGASVLLPSYRLAPEHPHPAPEDDVIAVLRAVRAAAPRFVAGGDSAGATLALRASLAFRDAGEPLPAGLAMLSPWVDLTLSGESVRVNEGRDAILRRKYLGPHARAHTGDLDPSDPRLSPLGAGLSGLPPTLIQCGGDELFLSEDTELAARLGSAGVKTELQVYEGMWHDFALHAAQLAAARRAVERMAEWARPLLA